MPGEWGWGHRNWIPRFPSWLESFSNTEQGTLKKRHIQGPFFFFPLASKVLICIRLSRVMTFNAINVTSIMPLHLSCLHLQNVNVSDYMAITRDPKEREEETQVSGTAGRPTCWHSSHPLPGSWKYLPSLSDIWHTHTCVHKNTHIHTRTELFLFQKPSAIQQTLPADSFGRNCIRTGKK